MPTPIITWVAPDTQYGIPLSSVQLNATANVAGFFIYSPAAGAILTTGSHTLTATFYPADSSYSNVSASTNINIIPAISAIIWNTPAAITNRTPLSSYQLNASTITPGVMVYNPPEGSFLPIGMQTLSVTFHPTDTSNYSLVTKTIQIQVIEAVDSLSLFPQLTTTPINSTFQLTLIATYTDGRVQDVTNLATYSSNNINASVSTGGFVNAENIGSVVITAIFNNIRATLNLVIAPFDSNLSNVNPKFYRSHVTQELLNYFDSKDLRVRRHPFTLDAQLLSLPAIGLDNLELRLNREKNRNLEAPCNIDNNGLYYGYTSNTINLSEVTLIQAPINGSITTLSLYDDTLPVPAQAILDTSIGQIPYVNSLVTSFTGGIQVLTNVIGSLNITGKLNFFLDQVISQVNDIDIAITGYTYPQPVWQKYQKKTTEALTINAPGQVTSLNKWQSVESITVRNLQAGSTLTCYVLTFNSPSEKDPYKFFTDYLSRGIRYPRYWSLDVDNRLILESKVRNAPAGYEHVQSYKTNGNIVDIAIEPNTYGIYAISNNTLYYADRREPMPSEMGDTVLTTDPIYSIQVNYDDSNPGIYNTVTVTPIIVPNSVNGFQYRIIVKDPSQSKNVLLPDGSMAAYSAISGWRAGFPTPVSVTLPLTGTYVFSIEAQDTLGNKTIDAFQYANNSFTPLATINLSNISSTLKGIAFDADGRLWIKDETNAYPLKLIYNGYVIDSENNTLYVTRVVDSVEVS